MNHKMYPGSQEIPVNPLQSLPGRHAMENVNKGSGAPESTEGPALCRRPAPRRTNECWPKQIKKLTKAPGPTVPPAY